MHSCWRIVVPSLAWCVGCGPSGAVASHASETASEPTTGELGTTTGDGSETGSDASRFRIVSIEAEESSVLRVTFSEEIVDREAVDPARFRLSVGRVEADRTRYSDPEYFFDPRRASCCDICYEDDLPYEDDPAWTCGDPCTEPDGECVPGFCVDCTQIAPWRHHRMLAVHPNDRVPVELSLEIDPLSENACGVLAEGSWVLSLHYRADAGAGAVRSASGDALEDHGSDWVIDASAWQADVPGEFPAFAEPLPIRPPCG